MLRFLETVALKVTEGCVHFDKRGLWDWHRDEKMGKYFNTIQENDQLLQSSCGEGTRGKIRTGFPGHLDAQIKYTDFKPSLWVGLRGWTDSSLTSLIFSLF